MTHVGRNMIGILEASRVQAKLEDFGTGWFGLTLGLSDHDITALIERLTALRDSRGHFHARSAFSGESGVGDIEFYWTEEDRSGALSIE